MSYEAIQAESGEPKGEDAFLVALVVGNTIREAARRSGMAERTAYRLASTPDFKQRLYAARRQSVERAFAKLSDLGSEAIETLRELLKDKMPSIRLGAVRLVLDGLFKSSYSLDLNREVEAMREKLEFINSQSTRLAPQKSPHLLTPSKETRSDGPEA